MAERQMLLQPVDVAAPVSTSASVGVLVVVVEVLVEEVAMVVV
jgi:hypothetical protein